MLDDTSPQAWLILEDGTVIEGQAFGATGTAFGELVFNTGMTGYQESLTDPSYNGQVLMFTYPMVGNYGVNPEDWESSKVWVRAAVVREWCPTPDHRLSDRTLDDWLKAEGIPGISGIDTRALTLKVRSHGCLRCFVTHDKQAVDDLVAKVAQMPSVEQDNLAGEASTATVLRYGRNANGDLVEGSSFDADARTIAILDTGIKRNIVRNLVRRANVVQHPWNARAADVLADQPDGLFLANGPGDPAHPDITTHTLPTIRALSEQLPTFGICYGNQLIARAWGGTTHKMAFGHRGANIPVRDEASGRIQITSQNHGFAVDPAGIPGTGLSVWQRCPNDGTVEALQHESLPIFTTQYHPEACPGPWDSGQLFDGFLQLIEQVRAGQFKAGHLPRVTEAVPPCPTEVLA